MEKSASVNLRPGGIAMAVGAVACAVACAAPVVGVVGLGAAAAWLGPGLELVAVVLFAGGAGVVGLGLWCQKRAAPERNCQPVNSGGCGCAPPRRSDQAMDEPVSCTLEGQQMEQRMNEFRQIFQTSFVSAERVADGAIRWRFQDSPGRLDELRELAERERSCCRFLRFDIYATGEEIWWDTRAQPDAEPVLAEWLVLPQSLAATPGLGAP